MPEDRSHHQDSVESLDPRPEQRPPSPVGRTSSSESPPHPNEGYAWYVVSVLTLAYIFSFVDRQILSMMVEDLKQGLNLTRDWQAGFLMGPAFAIFYTLFGIPLGRLADSRNRKVLISIGITLWSLMTAFCGVARNFWQMALMRAGVGMGEASLSPAAYSIITDYFRREKLARALGFYGMGIYFGGGLAFLIGGQAITYVRSTAPWDLPLLGLVQPWQKVFFFVGLPGLLVAPLLLLTVREPLRRGLLERGPRTDSRPKGVPLREVLHYIGENRRTILTHNIGFALLSFSSYGSAAWLPEMFRRVHGWPADKFGLIYGSIMFVCGAAGIFSGGILADWLTRKGYRDAKIRVGFIAAWAWLPFGIVFPLLVNDNLAMGMVAFARFLATMPVGVAPAANQEMMPNNLRGQTSAIYLFFVNMIGLAVGPLALALLTDFVFTETAFGVQGIRYSLLSSTVTAHLIASILLWKCMSCYRESLDRLKSYLGESDGA